MSEIPEPYRDPPESPTFTHTGFEQPVCRFGLPLITHYNDEWHVMGTCIMLTPGLALTAKYVINECLAEYHGIDNLGDDIEVGFSIEAIQFLDGETGVKWKVEKIHQCAHTDVSFMQMKPLFDHTTLPKKSNIEINLFAPQVGSRVTAFGYPNGVVSTGDNTINVSLEPSTAIGEVVEVHQEGRDEVRLPFPTFRTNARFDSGMSGGPVFDETGRLCGLICSSILSFCEDGDHVSYAALLWPSFGTEITMSREGKQTSGPYPAIELAEEGYIDAVGWENVNLPDGTSVRWQTSE